jgi:hypothetical protein
MGICDANPQFADMGILLLGGVEMRAVGRKP